MIDQQTFQTLYQTYYPDASLPYLLPEELPLINYLIGGNTDGQVSGDVVDMPWLFGAAAGFSQTFSNAQNQAANAPQALRPQIRLSQAYKVMGFQDKGETLSDGEASYGDLMEVTVDGARRDFLSKLDQLDHLNGSGNVGSITYTGTPQANAVVFNIAPTQLTGDTLGSPVGTSVIQTLFEINDQIVFTSTNLNDGTPPTVVAGPFTIKEVDSDNNTIYLDSNPPLTIGNTYGVAGAGNTMGFNAALIYPSVIGVEAYNPYGGVSQSDNFLGVNRSIYKSRTAGTWADVSKNFSMEGGIRRLATKMREAGVPPGGVWCGMYPTDYDALDTKLTTQNRYADHRLGEVFFDAIVINSTMGRINVIADPHQSQGRFRLYAPGAMQKMYRNGLPHFAMLRNGTDEQWGANYDGREKRLRAYEQNRCMDPRKLATGLLPPIT